MSTVTADVLSIVDGMNNAGADPRIELFDVDTAGPAALDGYYLLRRATAGDWSDDQVPAFEVVIGAIRQQASVFGPAVRWAAYLDDRLVGILTLNLPGHESAHVGMMQVTVHPEVRRRGVGSTLLDRALAELRARGRTLVEGWNVNQGGVGAQWAVAKGFTAAHATVTQQLTLDAVDPSLWDVAAPTGYRAVSWIDTAPEELVASYARARRAIQDAPRGDAGYQVPDWTVERVREVEAEHRATQVGQRVVVAVHESDGEVAGFTEVEVRPHRNDQVIQGDTAVLAAHRGHGLGRFIKAHMVRWLRSDLPLVQRVMTGTAASNTHMINVNHSIGYTTQRATVVLNAEVAQLMERAGQRTRPTPP
jgi:mycothiol synthase